MVSDDLGLRRALGDRVLPLLVAAMAFLAALAAAGEVGSRALARHWRGGAESVVTVQVPRPEQAGRLEAALAVLRAEPAVAVARALDAAELSALLRPWFGGNGPPPGLPLPGVVEVRLAPDAAQGPALMDGLAQRLTAAVPDASLESDGGWASRLAALANSLQACAWLALAVVALVAALVVAVATRSGLIARREAIRIVHGLGATDGYIAGAFARRATLLAASGGALGACAALPVLLALAVLAAPFSGEVGAQAAPAAGPAAPWTSPAAVWSLPDSLPREMWLALPALPALAAAIGFATAQATVRRWLRGLP